MITLAVGRNDNQQKWEKEMIRAFNEMHVLPAEILVCPRTFLQTPIWVAVCALLVFGPTAAEAKPAALRNDPVATPQLPAEVSPDKYLTAAAHFADAWLTYGIDNYGANSTPLLADMVDSEMLVAPRIGVAFDRHEKNQDSILSDHAGHQNFLRVLDSLTQLTGVPKYRQAAEDAVRYMFQNYWTDAGMLVWGEHYFVDLYTERATETKGVFHEMKGFYPYYEFLHRVEPEKATLMMQGMWLSHIRDWRSFAFTRHGSYNRQTLDGSAWEKPWEDPGIEYYSKGLSFTHTGFELANGALQVGIFAGDPRITRWGERLLYQFMRQANPDTHLISYHLYHPTQDRRQDRLLRTFGRKFPTAREKDVYIQGGAAMVNTVMPVMATYLDLSENEDIVLPEDLQRDLDRDINAIRQHLHGFFNYVYNPENHRLRYVVTDGTDLTGFVVNQSNTGYGAGHPGPVSDGWTPMSIYPSYSMALKLFPDDPQLWNALRTLMKNEGIGDIGSFEDKIPTIHRDTKCDYAEVVFAFVDLYQVSGNSEYLDYAEVIAENIYQKRYDRKTGLFKKDADHLLSQIDAYEPLAFITLWAARHGRLDEIPRYNGGGRCRLGSKLIFTGYGTETVKPSGGEPPFYLQYVPGKWMQQHPELLRDAKIPDGYKEELRERWNLTYP